MNIIGKMKPSKKTIAWAEDIENKLKTIGRKAVCLKWTKEGWAVECEPIILGEYKEEE